MAAYSASGGADGGGRSSPPAAAPRAVVDNLVDIRERTEMLRNMLQGSPTPPGTPAVAADAAPGTSELIDGIMSSLSSALSAALDTTAGGHGQGRRRRRRAGAVTGSGPQRRSTTRRRSYYRCTHKPDQGCRATRQVQASDDNPSEFVISYYGQHTCRDPSTIPLVIDAAAAPPDDCANLISFGSATLGLGASTTTLAAVPPQPQALDPTMFISRMVGYSSSLPAQDYRCGSEELHSSSASPAAEVAAVVGSAGTTSSAIVGSAPAEYYWGGHGAGSFPSSPSSLGFMTGSFGSFGNAGDDDMFGFDL